MTHSATTDRSDTPDEPHGDVASNRTSWLATLVGGAAGALTFALCTLWLGPPAGIVIALASTLFALARRRAPAAIAFVAAGTLAALALRASTALVLLAAIAFGGGLVFAVKRVREPELLA